MVLQWFILVLWYGNVMVLLRFCYDYVTIAVQSPFYTGGNRRMQYLTPEEFASRLDPPVTRARAYALYREGRYGQEQDGFIVFTEDDVRGYQAERQKRPKGGRPGYHDRPKSESAASL